MDSCLLAAEGSNHHAEHSGYNFFFLWPCKGSLSGNYIDTYLRGPIVGCDNANKSLYTINQDTGILIRHRYKPDEDVFEQECIHTDLIDKIVLKSLVGSETEFKTVSNNYLMQVDPGYPQIVLIDYRSKEDDHLIYNMYSRDEKKVILSGTCSPHESVLLNQRTPEGIRILGPHTALKVITLHDPFNFESVGLAGFMHQAGLVANSILCHTDRREYVQLLKSAGYILDVFKRKVPEPKDRYFWI